jgi:hypothetical protein
VVEGEKEQGTRKGVREGGRKGPVIEEGRKR